MTETAFIVESLTTNGYALLRNFERTSPSHVAFAQLGLLENVEGLNPIQTLVPRDQAEALPNTYSGNFGTEDFPLHTDLAHWAVPPRYLALRCLQGSPTVATRLFDGEILVRELGAKLLRMALVQPRRPMRNGKQLLRLLERTDDPALHRIRWDSIYLKAATPLASKVFASVQTILSEIEPLQVVLLDLGDTLIVDNWRCLHGRSSAAADSYSRHIDRAYLTLLT